MEIWSKNVVCSVEYFLSIKVIKMNIDKLVWITPFWCFIYIGFCAMLGDKDKFYHVPTFWVLIFFAGLIFFSVSPFVLSLFEKSSECDCNDRNNAN